MTNKEILDNWYQEISKYPILTLSEAKLLYESTIKEQDPVIKKQKRSKLITSTLYIIYNFINQSVFLHIKDNLYNMNELISDLIITWIKFIDSGKLLKARSFTETSEFIFYFPLEKNITDVDKYDKRFSILLKEDFNRLLNDFLDLKFNGQKVLIYDMINLIDTTHRYPTLYRSRNNFKLLKSIYNLLNNIYNIFTSKYDIKSINPKTLIHIKRILAYYSLINIQNTSTEDVIYEIEKDIENNIIEEKILNIMFNECHLDDGEKVILLERYGNNTKQIDIGIELNLSHQRVSQKERNALRKVKNNNEIKELIK